MRLIAVMCWYDERSDWLVDAIRSLAKAGVTHLVAVDGAYDLLPGGRPRSPADQHEAIAAAAAEFDLPLRLHLPITVWVGNEVEKRSRAFELAERDATPGSDWYFVMDADQVVNEAPGLVASLERTPLDVAEATFWERQPEGVHVQTVNGALPHQFQVRCLFRAIPGLRVVGNHYTYLTPDGRKLWGNVSAGDALEPALRSSVLIEHRTKLRDRTRHDQQYAYYRERDSRRLELAACARCPAEATHVLPSDWEPHPDGALAGWIFVCGEHADEVRAENAEAILRYGLDPSVLDVDLAASR